MNRRLYRRGRQNYLQSNFDKRERKKTRNAPVFEGNLVPLNVAHSACETNQNAQKSSRV
jgi:hypothetical protein